MPAVSVAFGMGVFRSYNPSYNQSLSGWVIMVVSTLLMEYANKADVAVRRWKTSLVVPPSSDDARVGSIIRSAFIRASQVASQFSGGPFYPDDNSWSYNGLRGLSRARIREEMEIAKDSMASAGEDWGIMARVSSGDVFFDVPIALDLEASAAENILRRMEGMESRFVDIEALSSVFPGQPVEIFFHADNWGALRDMSQDGYLPLDVAMDFRRPVVWDLLRAEMVQLAPEPLNPFSLEEFYTRFARSSRYDSSLMRSFRDMVETIAKMDPPVMSPAWHEWQSTTVDMLNSIGLAQPMDGISIILNFVVKEPVAEEVRDADGDLIETWAAVGYHNMIVCYGLHPLTANHVLDLVLREAVVFHDLPSSEEKRYVLMGASAIQDTMLSSLRVSAYGRTDAYDRMVEADMNPVAFVPPVEASVEPSPTSAPGVRIDDGFDDDHFD